MFYTYKNRFYYLENENVLSKNLDKWEESIYYTDGQKYYVRGKIDFYSKFEKLEKFDLEHIKKLEINKNFTKEEFIIISGYTGFLLCDYTEMKEDISKRLFTDKEISLFIAFNFDKVGETYKNDFLAIKDKFLRNLNVIQ